MTKTAENHTYPLGPHFTASWHWHRFLKFNLSYCNSINFVFKICQSHTVVTKDRLKNVYRRNSGVVDWTVFLSYEKNIGIEHM